MSRWLAAFRARQNSDAEVAEPASPKPEYPEKGEYPARYGSGAIKAGDIRDFRDIRITGARGTLPPVATSASKIPPALDLQGVVAARAASLAQAAADAFEALQAPDPALDAERAALAAFYAEPVTMPGAGSALVYCFPCGKPVLPRGRTWSHAGGWCCAACLSAMGGGG